MSDGLQKEMQERCQGSANDQDARSSSKAAQPDSAAPLTRTPITTSGNAPAEPELSQQLASSLPQPTDATAPTAAVNAPENEDGPESQEGEHKPMEIDGYKVDGYHVVIEQGIDGGWGAYAPSLPGLGVAADTREEVETLIREGIKIHVDALREFGDEVPEQDA